MKLRPGLAVFLLVCFSPGLSRIAHSQVAPGQATGTPKTKTRAAIDISSLAEAAPSAVMHKVKKGESLFVIARVHDTHVALIKTANHLQTNKLRIGQMLIVPPDQNTRAAATRRQIKQVAALEAGDAASEPAGSAALAEDDVDPDPDNPPQVGNQAPLPPDPGAGTPQDSAAQPLRVRLASMGMGFLGVRYRWTGVSEIGGFDCSGLVKKVFEKFNIILPRSSKEQFKVGEKIDKEDLEIGDLVFFCSRGKTPTHVGIYLGDDKFLHAARKARRVLISSLSAPWYTKRFLGARRLTDLWAEEPPAEPKAR